MSDEQSPDWADAAEGRVLDEAIGLAPTLHWNAGLVKAAARAAGLCEADSLLLLPKGPSDLAALLFRRHDAAALAKLASLEVNALKVRERIRAAVSARIETAMADEAAMRRCTVFLAAPMRAPLAFALGWDVADKLWRWAGDTATDENHYSKRAILGAVLASTLAVRLSGGPERAKRYLNSRIDQVMAFEKWKAGLPSSAAIVSDAASVLGRLRYGARRV